MCSSDLLFLNLGSTPEPALGENRTMPPAGLGESREQYYMPPANPSKLRTPPVAAPIKIDRMASLGAPVTGQVVTAKYAPRAGAQVVFVNASRQDIRQSATADAAGHYQVNLPAGEWYVYLGTGDGKAVYHKKITVEEYDNPTYRVVSR